MPIVHICSNRLQMLLLASIAAALLVMAASCMDSVSDAASVDDPEDAARGAFVLWRVSRGVQTRDVSTLTVAVQGDRADVELRAELRDSPAERWRDLAITIPVRRDSSGDWQVTPLSVVDRLVQAAGMATEVASTGATPEAVPTWTPEATQVSEPSSTPGQPSTPPPPPEGVVVYQSDWTQGMDGWIGARDWKVNAGWLENDGTRPSRDPWIEAPVQVDPWQAMVVEFEAEAPQAGYGSFGLVARASDAGWYEFGIRWEDFERGTGTPVVTLGASIRQETRRVQEELLAERKHLAPGAHLFRAEFRDGIARFFVDGEEVGAVTEGAFHPGPFLGLWSQRTPLKVSFFRVTLV